jgi:hypothetical protein
MNSVNLIGYRFGDGLLQLFSSGMRKDFALIAHDKYSIGKMDYWYIFYFFGT